jgi:hypothetical protein
VYTAQVSVSDLLVFSTDGILLTKGWCPNAFLADGESFGSLTVSLVGAPNLVTTYFARFALTSGGGCLSLRSLY